MAHCKEYKQLQLPSTPDAIRNSRPLELTAPSIAIFHPAFAQFVTDMDEPTENLIPSPSADITKCFTSDELDNAAMLVDCAAPIYQNEDVRHGEYAKIAHLENLAQNIVITLNKFGKHIKPDMHDKVGCALLKHVHAYFELLEIKNEVGEGGSDAAHQVERDFAAICASDYVSLIRFCVRRCN